MTGESVSATRPDTTTAAASVIANSRNSEPVSPPWKAMGVYTVASVMVMAMMGPRSSRAPNKAASMRFLPSRTCRSMFSTTTMASSTTRPTDSTMARMVSRFRLKPKAIITRRRADQRHGHGHQRHDGGAHRTQEQEHDHGDDQHGLDQRLGDFLQGAAHEHGAVPDQAHFHVRGQRGADALHFLAQRAGHFDFVRARQRPHAQIHGLLVVVLGDHRRFFGAELDAGDIGEAHDGAVALARR